MRQVYSSPDIGDAWKVLALLESNGIAGQVLNQHINMLGGLTFAATPNAWPSVVIFDNDRFEEAKSLIAAYEKPKSTPGSKVSSSRRRRK